jgi:TfoX N-terminal domain
MEYDEGLAERLRDQLKEQEDVEEKKMFGGLCFMVSRHMCCGIIGEKLMARVGRENYEISLSNRYAEEMKFTGKPMKGMIYVDHQGITEDEDLSYWIQICLQFIQSLPPKT